MDADGADAAVADASLMDAAIADDASVEPDAAPPADPLETLICDPQCDQSRCADRHECSGGTGDCREVPCGHFVPCLSGTHICDADDTRCFPSNGSCSDDPCPDFDGRIERIADIRCDVVTETCRLASSHISVNLTAPETIDVISPTAGYIFATEADVRFEWSATSSPVLVQVLDAVPEGHDDFLNHVIWGHYSGDDNRKMRWSDGGAVVDGAWQMEPLPAPVNRTMYLLVIEVSAPTLRSKSRLIPFRVGDRDSWPRPGNRCGQRNEVPGDCEHPGIPQVCANFRCRALCVSSADCADFGQSCGGVVGGVRFCVD